MLLVAVVFVALFILVTLLDTLQYQPDVEQYRERQQVSAGP